MFKRIALIVLCFALMIPLMVSAQEDDPITDVIEYIQANPDKIGIACQVLDDPANTYAHNPDESFVLASTGKIIILAEYARQVAAGDLDPETPVSLDALDTYYLPFTDGGAHPAWLDTLPEDADETTLAEVVNGMIEFSSNANTDYVLATLGYPDFAEVYAAFDVDDMGQFAPVLGTFLLAFDSEIDVDTFGDQAEFNAAAIDLTMDYATDGDLRGDMRARVMLAPDIGNDPNVAAKLNAHMWRGTPADFQAIMHGVVTGDALGEDASAIIREVLEWPMQIPGNDGFFDSFGTKGGSLQPTGTLTAALYGAGIDGPTVALAVFYRDLEPQVFNQWQTDFAYQLIEVAGLIEGDCQIYETLLAGDLPG